MLGWLMQCSRSAAGAAAVRLAVLLDLLYFMPGVDSVMSIEPACLVIVRPFHFYTLRPVAVICSLAERQCRKCRVRKSGSATGVRSKQRVSLIPPHASRSCQYSKTACIVCLHVLYTKGMC